MFVQNPERRCLRGHGVTLSKLEPRDNFFLGSFPFYLTWFNSTYRIDWLLFHFPFQRPGQRAVRQKLSIFRIRFCRVLLTSVPSPTGLEMGILWLKSWEVQRCVKPGIGISWCSQVSFPFSLVLYRFFSALQQNRAVEPSFFLFDKQSINLPTHAFG